MEHERLYVLVRGKATEEYMMKMGRLATSLAIELDAPLVGYDMRQEIDGIAEFSTNSKTLQTKLVEELKKLDPTKIIEFGDQTVDLSNPHRRN